MTELLNCPFCGGEARYREWGGEECDIEVDHNDGCWMIGWNDYFLVETEYKEAMVNAWNTRHERTSKKVPGRMKYGTRMPKCSECGQSLGDSRWSYCPNCGSRVVDGDAS